MPVITICDADDCDHQMPPAHIRRMQRHGEWLKLQVTESVKKYFCSSACAIAWLQSNP